MKSDPARPAAPVAKSPHFYEAVWSLVRHIPPGRVASYGQVATWLGSPRAARAVGYAMFNVSDDVTPWQRVINGKGEISIGGHQHRPDLQRELLEREGVEFDAQGKVDLARFGWQPEAKLVRDVVAGRAGFARLPRRRR